MKTKMKFPDSFQLNRPLGELTTFGIGGNAKYFIVIQTIEDMQNTLSYCYEQQLPYFILGKGSNSLFDDRGFDGLVIANKIDFFESPSQGMFHVGAGYSFSLLGSQTARQGWSGLEFASGIPGSVGGAVYMNAGANGREVCESIISVDFINEKGELNQIQRSEIEFRYRFSSFQKQRGSIVGATFQLTQSDEAREKQLQIIQYRKNTQPLKDKSAGCVFRNPSPGISAGALIEKSGLKGMMIGGAQVSPVHANFLINAGGATAQDILKLIHFIKDEVKKKMEIELENEVRCVPYQLPWEKEGV